MAKTLSPRLGTRARVGLVLGSGLGAFADALEQRCAVPFADIEGMPSSAVAGHAGLLVSGMHRGVALLAMQGRVHLYEGHSPAQVVLGVRTMIAMGVRTLILTNAAGGIRDDLDAGALMLIEDHLNLTGTSCLVGQNDAALGVRFPALSDAYAPELRALASKVAQAEGFALPSGVYAGMLGPAYETPAEVRMLRALGADAVGMSTVLETIAARHMGARVLGISCITNRAAGLTHEVPDHADVQRTAKAAAGRFTALLSGVIAELGPEGAA